MPNVYTRGGDKGTTALYGGSRVAKHSGQVEAYGALDEANSAIGFARSLLSPTCWMRPELHEIQQRLFTAAAEVASDDKGRQILDNKISQADIDAMEALIDRCLGIAGLQHEFVIPGKDPASGALHIARTVIRRAERRLLKISQDANIRSELIKYVNRLSDVLFACARVQERTAQMTEVEQIVRRIVEQNWDQISALPSQGGTANSDSARDRNGWELPQFNLEIAARMASAAEDKATEMGVPVVISVVDEGGNLVLLHRMEGSLLASLDIAQGKAFTSAALKIPTSAVKDLAKEDGDLFGIESSNQGRIICFGGGLPIFVNGEIRGGIGVSGGTVDEDLCIVNHAFAAACEG